MRENNRPDPDRFDWKVEIHCPACHRNTWARRRREGGAVCWECGALLPRVKACVFHDDRIRDAETVDERIAAIHPADPLIDRIGSHCACAYRDDETGERCGETWTDDEIDALPLPWIDEDTGPLFDCPDCPDEWLVAKNDPDSALVLYRTADDEWSTRWILAVRYEKPEKAWNVAVNADAESFPMRLRTVVGCC